MDFDKIKFQKTVTLTLEGEFQKWQENNSEFYAEDYVCAFKAIEDFLPYVRNIDFSFDEWNGHASVRLEDCDFSEYEKPKMKHVIRILNRELFSCINAKTYYRNRKRRTSKVLAWNEFNISGLWLDYNFTEILKNNFRELCKHYNSESEIDIYEEIREFYDSSLSDFIDIVVKCYKSELSQESFIEYLRDNDPETFAQIEQQLAAA